MGAYCRSVDIMEVNVLSFQICPSAWAPGSTALCSVPKFRVSQVVGHVSTLPVRIFLSDIQTQCPLYMRKAMN